MMPHTGPFVGYPRLASTPTARVHVVYETREAWAHAAIRAMRPWLSEAGVPDRLWLEPGRDVLVSVGYGPGQRQGTTLGVCYVRRVGSGVNNIFLQPEHDDLPLMLAAWLHEYLHAVDDCANGHRGRWADWALALGFPRPLTSLSSDVFRTKAPDLYRRCRLLAAALGPFGGHKVFDLNQGTVDIPRWSPPGHGGGGGRTRSHGNPQTNRWRLARCEGSACPAGLERAGKAAYKVRLSRGQAEQWGSPLCPSCETAMTFYGK